MTTPPTPANWYPDPDDATRLRYWDGWTWTEHRAPAPGAADVPAEPETTAEDVQQQPVQPYDTHPPSAVPPAIDDDVSWNPPLPSWDSLSTEPKTDAEPAEVEAAPPPEDSTPAAFAPPPAGPPPGYYPPPPPPSGGTSNPKLVIGIVAGVAVLLVVIAVVVALVVMRTDKPTAASGPTTSSSTSTSTSASSPSSSPSAAAPTESLTPPPPGAEGNDGDYAFAIAGTETGDTITSTVSDSVQSAADGMYYVVYLNVTNTGAAPLTFVATFQQLNAAGQTFPLDDEATAFLGGTVAEIGPGEQKQTPWSTTCPWAPSPAPSCCTPIPRLPASSCP
ncbi:DUF2510 domain-containing protein [Mycobacterium sp. NPDC006124]|uniref:DUF2510 domain-containing protein n=1 Tax=Mycobacterium sp. NPDC006124 TaxID=3156729 RepID=UPI00339DD3DE